MLDHVRLLPEGPGADLADEGLLAGVDLEVLLEVEPLAVDEEAAHRAALVAAPVVVHVLQRGRNAYVTSSAFFWVFLPLPSSSGSKKGGQNN